MGMSAYYRRTLGEPKDPTLEPVMIDTPPAIKNAEPVAVLAEIFKPKEAEKKVSLKKAVAPVSYTHLTLPTKRIV